MQMCWSDVATRPQIVEIDMLVSKLFHTYHNGRDNQKSLGSSDDFDKKWEMLNPNNTQNMDANSDSVLLEMGDDYIVSTSKPLSPSLNNLHGSLDNLLATCEKSHFLSNENVRNICDSDSVSGPESFDEGRNDANHYSTDILKQVNSDSETEDENWREKVEKGTYTEKVRVKSKSITDLMVLTHIDYCESESETPFSSINYKVNSKTQRSLTSKPDFPYLPFGSEGNLLSIQDPIPDKTKVNDELKKFHEEYNCGQLADNCAPKVFETESNHLKEKVNMLCELNIQPQVYNLYNVSIDNLPYVNNKLSDYISFNPTSESEIVQEKSRIETVPRISENRLCDNSFSRTIDDTVPVAKNESEVNLIFDEISVQTHHEDNKQIMNDEHHQENVEYNNEENNSESLDTNQDSAINENLVSTKVSYNDKPHAIQLEKSNICNPNLNRQIFDHTSVPFVLFKTLPTKIQLENFSSITLFDILIEPYNKKNLISTLMTWSRFIEKAIDIKHNRESHVDDNSSGPKSIIFYNTVDTYIMKKQESVDEPSTSSELNNAWADNQSVHIEANNLNYSLETWDSFLDKALDEQKENDDSFYNFSIEPKSMIFVNDENLVNQVNENDESSCKLASSEIISENCDDKEDSLESGRESENTKENEECPNVNSTSISKEEEENDVNETYEGRWILYCYGI